MASSSLVSTPAGACDCHIHIYDDAYALAPTSTFKPPLALLSAYRQVQRSLGLARVVLVQPSGYGFDNRCLLDALAQLGSDAARGVVIDAAFKALLAVLDRGERWVKLSAPYETSKLGPPHYDDVALLAKALAKTHPERCLWASNWPHPNQVSPPSNEAMLNLLAEWAGEAATREKILVHNPAALYGF